MEYKRNPNSDDMEIIEIKQIIKEMNIDIITKTKKTTGIENLLKCVPTHM